MIAMKEKPAKRGRPVKTGDEKPPRVGKSYQAYYDEDLWARLEAYMATLRIRGDYKEHIEAALDEYLAKQGFPAEEEPS